MTGATAFAQFTATATATGNTFSTTTPTLTISTDNGSTFGSSKPGFTVGGLVPGGTTADQAFKLQNINTDVAGDLTVTAQFSNTGGGLNANDISFTVTCGGGSPVTDTYANWVSTPHSIGSVAHNSTIDCTMSAHLNSGVDNSDAGQSRNFDAVFTGSVGS